MLPLTLATRPTPTPTSQDEVLEALYLLPAYLRKNPVNCYRSNQLTSTDMRILGRVLDPACQGSTVFVTASLLASLEEGQPPGPGLHLASHPVAAVVPSDVAADEVPTCCPACGTALGCSACCASPRRATCSPCSGG